MFIDEWFDVDFYQKLPLNYRNSFCFGQIFWTHAYYPHENLMLWRPVPDPSEPIKTIATIFEQKSAGSDAFKRSLPLEVPKLATNEEFIVIRAKRRPVVLIYPEAPITAVNSGYRGKISRKRCLVAQAFGLKDVQSGQQEFASSFADRVRKMEFPQLLYLPAKTGALEVESMLRLDEVQSVFTPHLEATQYALGEKVLDVLRGQLRLIFTDEYSGEYAELRELLLNS